MYLKAFQHESQTENTIPSSMPQSPFSTATVSSSISDYEQLVADGEYVFIRQHERMWWAFVSYLVLVRSLDVRNLSAVLMEPAIFWQEGFLRDGKNSIGKISVSYYWILDISLSAWASQWDVRTKNHLHFAQGHVVSTRALNDWFCRPSKGNWNIHNTAPCRPSV